MSHARSDQAPERSSFRRPDDARSPRAVKSSLTLQFVHRVFGLDHLHYGIFSPDDPLDLGGLEAAQERYVERLIELLPNGIETVLDVGTGTGVLSQRLVEHGLEVEGLSPDPYQQELYLQRVQRPFHLGRFQEFVPARPYDLVLMAESAQYIWLDSLISSVIGAAAGGHWLLADYFVTDSSDAVMEDSGHPLDEFRRRCREAGLELEHEEDVTEQVLPTLELAQVWLTKHVRPAVEILSAAAADRRPFLTRVARRLFRRRIERFEDTLALVDPERFARTKRYMVFRFKVPDGAAPGLR